MKCILEPKLGGWARGADAISFATVIIAINTIIKYNYNKNEKVNVWQT